MTKDTTTNDTIKGAALVTGGAARLGRAMVLELAAMGHDVVVHYADSAEKAEETATEARAFGVRAATIQCDLLDRSAVAGLIDGAIGEIGGPLGILINNASIFEYDNLQSASPESWDRHMGSNLYAPLFLSQAFAAQIEPGAKDAAGEPMATAAIINMIDQRVRKLTPEFTTYTIAKLGLWGLTQTAAQSLAPHVRVNAIGPGPTLKGARQSEDHFANQRAATILERGANLSDITSALRFLLTSHSVTGQLLCVDGGQHLGWQTPDVLGRE